MNYLNWKLIKDKTRYQKIADDFRKKANEHPAKELYYLTEARRYELMAAGIV